MSSGAVYDYAVVGAGIAGLAIAEIFARSGHTVVLIEQNEKVCLEASGSHHCWFHFGSLYSIFPNRQLLRTLVGGIDDLLAYYADCEGMNLHVGEGGKLKFRGEAKQWIRDEPIEYIVAARNDQDFRLNEFDGPYEYARKLFFTATWDLTIKLFISRHQRFARFDWRSGPASEDIPRAGLRDYSRAVIHKVGPIDVNLEKHTHFRVTGYDRPMNARSIIESLLRAFVGAGGQLMFRSEYRGHRQKADLVEVDVGDAVVKARRLVLAAGAGLHALSEHNLQTRIVASPLLVAYPCVCDANFVRLTPFVSHTVNHLKHWIDGRPYSVIGGGYAANPDDARAVSETRKQLENMAQRVFPKLQEAKLRTTYVSNKTEITPTFGERNYQYLLREVTSRVFAAVPGKFSLAFSLAVNTYKKLEGREPRRSPILSASVSVTGMVSPLRHEALVQECLAGEHPVGQPMAMAASAAPMPRG